ncbi:hypothetical protein [Acrocarpospora catenulata]|uniref:hypothetical protein n=1 Tax=Acrocarpospora catenulata TaxID=2836182 RepID=UPI001BDA98B7|nr:hypothetical protein [Acrocarpospora catenulata]
MLGRKKITHIISTPPKPEASLADHIRGGPIAVYGRKDLKARRKAAEEAGVELTVRKLRRGER